MTSTSRERFAWTAVLFDLDGTLLDTRVGVRGAIEAAFAEVNGQVPHGGRVDLSLPLDEMIQSVDPSMPYARRRRVSEAFRRHYDTTFWSAASVYPGAESCLSALHSAGVRLFVVTNKRAAAAQRLLAFFDLDRYLDGVVGQPPTGHPKPKSDLVSDCVAASSLDTSGTVVVGDSDQDAAAAAATGMVFIGVTSGAGPLGHAPSPAERVEVDSLDEVAALVLRRLGGERS